eukprot:Platyproteum_vivax@DN663_c0_g1_i1.p1
MRSVIAARNKRVRLMIENLEDYRNIHAVFRTADALGLQYIHVVQDYHISPRKMPSSGTAQWLSVHKHDNPATCLHALKKNGFKILATDLSEAALPLQDCMHQVGSDLQAGAAGVAVVVGNEGGGVLESTLQLADYRTYIPQNGWVQSMNVSVTCGIVLHETLKCISNAVPPSAGACKKCACFGDEYDCGNESWRCDILAHWMALYLTKKKPKIPLARDALTLLQNQIKRRSPDDLWAHSSAYAPLTRVANTVTPAVDIRHCKSSVRRHEVAKVRNLIDKMLDQPEEPEHNPQQACIIENV